MLYNRVLAELKDNKTLREQNKEIAIPFPFERFSKYIPGIQRGRYVIVTANSKVGKSKITDFMYFYTPIEYIRNNKTDLDVKILYFSLEMSKEDKIKELVCYLLYKYYGYNYSPEEISSVFKHLILPDQVLSILESTEFTNLVAYFESKIIFYDTTRNPYGIYKTVREYAHENGKYFTKNRELLDTKLIEVGNEFECKRIDHYQPNNPNEYVIVITDHISLLTPDNNQNGSKTIHDAMQEFSSKYCLGMRDRWKYTIVNVQQQAAAMESLDNFKLDRLQPSANGLGDNKLTGRDVDMILGVFAPTRHKIKDYEGYDISKLKDNHRELSVILNRRGPALSTQLFFNGACSYFQELPRAEEFQKNPNLYTKWII